MITEKAIQKERQKNHEQKRSRELREKRAARKTVTRLLADKEYREALQEAYAKGILTEISEKILRKHVVLVSRSFASADLEIALAIYRHLGMRKAVAKTEKELRDAWGRESQGRMADAYAR